MTGAELADAARSLVGVPFRLHGRDPRLGLDCLGVLAAALGESVRLPNGYPMRGGDADAIAGIAVAAGLHPARGQTEPGDILLLRPGPYQHHIAIATGSDTIVHAHAGLRRVVHGPLPPEWPTLGHWRLHP
ncbi:C40 family peptidase [Novosphingobium sp. PhB165]|uniref:C40 family peptidase n=1 Tax=Novosphingobium sp. PhB165 TaxID=2485105 RepID=UPI001049A779|nr:C40 family peptidase [Novosphingobium sp. PhB165]